MSNVKPRAGGPYSLFCSDCGCWVPNTANHEMRKEGCYAHSHICHNGICDMRNGEKKLEEAKQIEEMAKDIACKIAWDEDEIPTVNCLETAKRLYCEGYRKQSDTAKEIFVEIEALCEYYKYIYEDTYAPELKDALFKLKKKYVKE